MLQKHQVTKTQKERITKNKVLVKSCLRQAGWWFSDLVAKIKFSE
jgi:hypothetical protein